LIYKVLFNTNRVHSSISGAINGIFIDIHMILYELASPSPTYGVSDLPRAFALCFESTCLSEIVSFVVEMFYIIFLISPIYEITE